MKPSLILTTKPSADYELLDSGEGEKLERFGAVTLSRPDPQALWRKNDAEAWKKADGVFTREGVGSKEKGEGGWNIKKDMPTKWKIGLAGLTFWIRPTAFKHVGLFPEQSPNWEWLKKTIEARLTNKDSRTGAESARDRSGTSQSEPVAERALGSRREGAGEGSAQDLEVLNLFGYTGGATLACAQAGAKVVHVDGSKAALAWARENAEASGLAAKPIRWILDDARAFVRREIKRGRKYAGIIMDPPSFGHGPENELWKIEEHFLSLLDECVELLADKPLFFLINGYSAGYSSIAYANNLLALTNKFGGEIEQGELAIEEKGSGRLLPCGIFTRWVLK